MMSRFNMCGVKKIINRSLYFLTGLELDFDTNKL